MTVLVDPAIWRWRGHAPDIPSPRSANDPRVAQLWAHLASDESLDELHCFAAALGLARRSFQGDHYDVPATVRERALELGAESVSSRELVMRLRAAGLRRAARRA